MNEIGFEYSSENQMKKRIKEVKRYDVSVPCYNLYQNKEKSIFKPTNGILAETEKEALEKTKSMLKKYFPKTTYKEQDITIKEF